MSAAVAAGYGGFTVPLAILWSVCLGVAVRPRRSGIHQQWNDTP